MVSIGSPWLRSVALCKCDVISGGPLYAAMHRHKSRMQQIIRPTKLCLRMAYRLGKVVAVVSAHVAV